MKLLMQFFRTGQKCLHLKPARVNLLVVLLVVVLAGCHGSAPKAGGISSPGLAATDTPSQTLAMPALALLASETPTLLTSTPTQTLTPVPTLTPTPTPDPMSIQALRARPYPGSPIVLEDELAPGSNYRQYYASYLSDGLKIYGLLTIPDGAMPPGGWPVIVFNHGYIPPAVYRTTERYVAYVARLAQAGYIVFKIDYRGHDRSEGVARGAYGDPGYTIDVLNAVAALKRFPQANPHKIGMWGHSMGGFLTLRAMVISPDIKAGVIWAGVVGTYPDLVYNWHHSQISTPAPNARGWSHWFNQYGAPDQDPAFWDSISATSYLADLSGPLQLHHDVGDSEVPVVFSRELVAGIKAVGGTVEFYTYPGDDHNLAQSFTLAMDRTIQFFDKYLKSP
jgi:uncharacterized protein